MLKYADTLWVGKAGISCRHKLPPSLAGKLAASSAIGNAYTCVNKGKQLIDIIIDSLHVRCNCKTIIRLQI